MVDLTDAWEKVRWAEHHFEPLRKQVEAFEKRDAHRITVSVDKDAGEYRFHVSNLELVDPDWGLMLGDCIHNARTALDYLVVRLWALVNGIEPDEIEGTWVSFPIHFPRIEDNATDDEIKRAWDAARNTFKSRTAKFSEQPSFSGYLTTIEQLQPFNQSNPSIWGMREHGLPRFAALPNALERLARLDNADKHRVPHVTWATVNFFGAETMIDRLAPPEFKSIGGGVTNSPLEENAEVGSWRFETPLPSDWKPSEVDMHRCFPLQVAFGDPLPFAGVVEVVSLCLWGVKSVLNIFEPVFRPQHAPPLPVTAIPDPFGG